MNLYENLHKAHSLIDRMEKKEFGRLTESAAGLKDIYYSPNEFMDMLEGIRDTAIIRVGIIQACDLVLPVVKRKNPETNRMKGYTDYSSFNTEGNDNVAAIAKLTSYGLMYRKRKELGNAYKKWKQGVNDLNPQYGLPIIKDKENDYAERSGYGNGETSVYSGNNKEKEGNAYMSVNTAIKMGKTTSTYYLLNAEGRKIRELSEEELKDYAKKKKSSTYADALRKMGHEEAYVQEYLEKFNALGKMNYRRLEFSHILYVAANIDGKKVGYINDNITRNIDGVNLNSADFAQIARERYKQENPSNDAPNPAKGQPVEKPAEGGPNESKGRVSRMVQEAVRRAMFESFGDEFNKARDNHLSKGGLFGLEMKNGEGDWEYGDVTFDPNTNKMSCMGVSIEVDPDMSIDQNLEALYDELINNGYTDD